MKRSSERILTTHTGSLPRPEDLTTMLYAKDKGELQDQAAFEGRVRAATAEVVRTPEPLVRKKIAAPAGVRDCVSASISLLQ